MFLCENSLVILNVFSILTLRQIFLNSENLFHKTRVPLLVESAKIDNTKFLYETALSEANVKTNIMVSSTRTYHKKWSFASI